MACFSDSYMLLDPEKLTVDLIRLSKNALFVKEDANLAKIVNRALHPDVVSAITAPANARAKPQSARFGSGKPGSASQLDSKVIESVTAELQRAEAILKGIHSCNVPNKLMYSPL